MTKKHRSPYPELQRRETRKRLWLALCGLITAGVLLGWGIYYYAQQNPVPSVNTCTEVLRSDLNKAILNPDAVGRKTAPPECDGLTEGQIDQIVKRLLEEALSVEPESPSVVETS